MLRIAIVCDDNRGRSALTECAMNYDWFGRAFHVCSAGLNETEGLPAHDIARRVALDAGFYSIETHLSRRACAPLLNYADLILVMNHCQRNDVLLRLPSFKGRVHRLGDLRGTDIHDPLVDPQVCPTACLELIRECLQDWAVLLDAKELLPLLGSRPEIALARHARPTAAA